MFENRETIASLPTAAAVVARNADWSIVDLSAGARVARGVLYVDRTYPGRLGTLSVTNFDISWCTRCVIGQIHDTWLGAPERQLGEGFLRAHGFIPFEVPGQHSFVSDACDLNSLWREAIRTARGQ